MDNQSSDVFSKFRLTFKVPTSPNQTVTSTNSSPSQDDYNQELEKSGKDLVAFMDNIEYDASSDKTQQMLNRFVETLTKAGLKKDAIDDVLQEIVATSSNSITYEIARFLSDTDFEALKKFESTNPTSVQKIMLMDELCKSRTGKSLEELQDDIIERVVMRTIREYNDRKEILESVMDLSEETQDKVLNLLKEGKYDEATNLISNKGE